MSQLMLITTLVLSTTGFSQASADTDPVVGFVHEISGDWEDTVHKSALALTSDVRQHASIVRKDSKQRNTHIEIYLANGQVEKRDCNRAACANPIVIQLPDSDKHLDYFQLLKELFFAPAHQEVPAASFVYRVTYPPRINWACQPDPEVERLVNEVSRIANCQPAPVTATPTELTPRDLVAGSLMHNGTVNVWGAERLGDVPPTNALKGDGLTEDMRGGPGVKGVLGRMTSVAGRGRTLEASNVRLSEAFQIAAATTMSTPSFGTVSFCRTLENPVAICSQSSMAAGIYVGEDTQLYLFASDKARACMSEAFDLSGTLNGWMAQTDDPNSLRRLNAIKAYVFDRRARACGHFHSLDRADITFVPAAQP